MSRRNSQSLPIINNDDSVVVSSSSSPLLSSLLTNNESSTNNLLSIPSSSLTLSNNNSSSSSLLTIPTLNPNMNINTNNNTSNTSNNNNTLKLPPPILTKRNNSSAILQAQQLHLGLLQAPTPTFTTSKLSPRRRSSIIDININNSTSLSPPTTTTTTILNSSNSDNSISISSSSLSNNNNNNNSTNNVSSNDSNNSSSSSLNSSSSPTPNHHSSSSSSLLNNSSNNSNNNSTVNISNIIEDNLAHSILYQYEKLHQRILVPLFFILTYLYLCIETTDYHWTMAICCFAIMAINLPHFRDVLQSSVIEKIILINNLNIQDNSNNNNTNNSNNNSNNNNNSLDENKKQDIIFKIYTYKIVIIVNIILQFFRLIISNINPTYSWMTIGFMASTVHNLSSFILHNSIALGDNGLSTALWTILPLNILSIGTSLILSLYFNRWSESFGCLTMLTIFNLVFNTTSYKLMEKLNMMNIMTGRLKDANKSKNSLVSSISHEFRSPLMSISGCIELLLDTKLTEDQIQYLKTIGCCSSILLTLIEDILQYSKLEKGNLEIANSTVEDSNNHSIFSLGECIEHVKSITTTYAQNFNVKINVNISKYIPTFVMGESVRLQQVLINLLTNAIKASNSNGIVTLQVETIENDFINTTLDNNNLNNNTINTITTDSNNTINNNNNIDGSNDNIKQQQLVIFKIIDNGKGIPKNVQELLFKPFFSGFLNSGNGKSAVMGTGLGLSIAKKIVNYNFKGELSYESNIIPPNTGTTFIVKIPFILPDHRKKNSLKYIEEMLKSNNNNNMNTINGNMNGNINGNDNDQKSHLLHKELFMLKPMNNSSIKRNIYELPILLAEDNPINLLVLKRLLEKGGFTNIVTCSNGLELVEEFKKKFYDLIITDLHMPLMSGIEASNMIRKLNLGQKTKIIMLTADALLDKLEFMESIDASLNKPITSENLNKAVISVLS